MGKRLGIGVLKGLLLGAAVGAGITFGAHWSTPSGGVLAYLLALGVGGTAGIFGGHAPWKEGAWLVATIKALFGVGVAAALYWLASSYGAAQIPWPGVDHRVAWTSLPLLFLPAIGGLYGALVELDHDEGATRKDPKKSAAKTRVAMAVDDTEAADEPAATRAVRKK